MADIRDTLRLEVDQALAAIDQVERRLDSAVEAKVTVDTRSATVLASALETAERAAATLRGETDATADAAARAERSYADLAASLGVSETQAAQLADEAREAALSAGQIERQARDIAQAMGLSEGETRQFVSSLRTANRTADNVAESSDRIGAALRRVGGLALAAFAGFGALQAIQGLARGAGSAITAYSDSIEEASKAQTVFGSSIDIVNAFVEDSANTLRASKTEAIQATAAFGAFFTGIGVGAEQAARLSTQTVQLAADLASFNNLSFGEALEKLRSGLAGETEPLRQLGAGFNEAELKAKALQLGLGGVTGELSEQEKVTARLAIITERTASAQGDAARTADTLAGRLRRSQAAAKDLAPAFGEALLPVVETFLDNAPALLGALEGLVPVVSDLADEFGRLAPEIAEAAQGLPGFLATVTNVGRTGRDSAQLLGSAFTGVRASIQALVGVTRFDPTQFSEGFDKARDAAAGFTAEIDDIQIDRALERINKSLQAGVKPADAFGIAVSELAQNAQLTTDDINDLAAAANLDSLDTAGFEALIAGFDNLKNSLPPGTADLIAGELLRISNAAIGARLALSDTEFGGASAFEGARRRIVETAEAARVAVPSLASLRQAAEEADGSFLDFASGLATANTSILDGLGGVDRIEGALLLIGEASENAAERYRASFDVILTETNKAGEEVPRTVEQLVTDFETQAQRLADFQATIATLALSGFDDLASRLQSEGPAALEAGLGFLDDIDAATRAEAALEGQGVEIANKIESDLAAAVAAADFAEIGTLIGLGIAEGINSPSVLALIEAAGRAAVDKLVGTVRGELQVRSPSRVFMRIGEFAGEGLIIGFSEAANRRVPALQGVQLPAFAAGGGGGGGGTVVNNTISNTVTLAGRDEGFAAAVASQLAGTVGGALRGFSGGAVRV